MYIITDGITITGIFDGIKIHEDGIDVPDTFQGVVGDKLKLFDRDWIIRPFINLVSDGLAPVPDGYKLVDKTLQELTEKESNEKKYITDKKSFIDALCSEVENLLNKKYYQKQILFKNRHIRADQTSQKIITGYMTEILLGSRSYPLSWITCENDIVTIDNADELKTVVQPMSSWVESSIFSCRDTKTALEKATDFETAWKAFTEYRDIEI